MHRTLIVAALLAAAGMLGAGAAHEVAVLRTAHSTFTHYYAFGGCAQLLRRTPDEGVCRLASGKVITIVRFRERWYLAGDLPVCLGRFCL